MNKIIQENLDNSNLDVALVCKEIGMSRASLYNKLKALTDMGANDYINKFRMEKAITLMTGTELSFTEIAEKVGFTTSAISVRLSNNIQAKRRHSTRKSGNRKRKTNSHPTTKK